MKKKYYVLTDTVNLIGVVNRNQAAKKTIIDGTENPRTFDLPDGYFVKGDKIEIELNTLNEVQLLALCALEKNLTIIRCDTDFNKQIQEKGIEIDLFKTLNNNQMKFVNEIYPHREMEKFCKNWKDEKAFILNHSYQRYYDTMIDKFYIEQIQVNKTKKVI